MFIGDLLKFIVYAISSCSQLFVLCWNADALIQHSIDLQWNLYSCNWEGGYIIDEKDYYYKNNNNNLSTYKLNGNGNGNFYDSSRTRVNKFLKQSSASFNGNYNVKGFEVEKELKQRKTEENRFYYPAGVVFNKKLAFMIMRSQKPCRITAMKFSVVSLQSFRTIMGTSMSYFTLLQSLLE